MKAIVGLGNPGADYAKTRHNIGFLVVDRLHDLFGTGAAKTRFKSLVSEAIISGEKVVLLKPQTYMNLSGDAVRLMMDWYKLEAENLLVVMDDIDLPFQTLRLRERGTAGGHNGLASILQSIGTRDVARLRIGIGRGNSQARSHVLSRFSNDEASALRDVLARAVEGVQTWVSEGAIIAMNLMNARDTSQTKKENMENTGEGKGD